MSEIRKISQKNEPSYDDALDKLFKGTESPESLIVELPSKSKFYDSVDEVVVSPLTFEDEERILNSKGKGTDVINLLLEKCVKGVSVPDLLHIDKLFLLLKIREASYGTIYRFDIGCPACGDQIKSEIDLANDLNINYVTDDFEDPRPIMLPKLGVEALVRFPRNKEENLLYDSGSTSKNIYRFVVSLDGNSDPVFISKAIKRMHIVDVKMIASEITKGEFGLDPRFMFECPSCGHNSMMEIPLDASFFSVT